MYFRHTRLLAWIAALALSAAAAWAQSTTLDEAEGWERSAISRNDNANALEAEAADLLDSAADFRDRSFLYDAERRTNFKRAGEAELRAGELGVAAAGHYRRAAENWSRAANAYGVLENSDQQTNAEELAVSCRDAAKLALTQAVGSFESAAEAFADANAAIPKQREVAESKAEEARQRLAGLL